MGLNIVGLLTSPLRVAKKILVNLLQLTDSSYALALPVAGLDEEAAHQILSTLRAAEHSEEEADMPSQWLAALQLAQIASDRLVWDLSRVEESLEFWSERLRQGQHLRTMLFGQGPVSFGKDVARLVSRHKSSYTPSDRIERRVIVLRDLRAKLAESLAQVHAAASLLHLKAAKTQESGEDFDPGLLHKIAKQAINDCCFSTAKAYNDVKSYSNRKLKGIESMSVDLRQTAMAQMLRLHSKRMFHFGSSGSALDLARLNGESTNGQKKSLTEQDKQEKEGLDGNQEAASPPEEEATSLEQLQQTLNVDVEVEASTTAHNALSQANTIASVERHIIDLPKWLRMPNKISRNWIVYTFMGLGVTYTGIFFVRHSRLVGSRDLEQWTLQAVRAVRDAYQQHILQPLLAVRNELFQTFRQKRSIVSTEDYEADKESLVRMLEDFRKDNASSVASVNGESELSHPDIEVSDINMTQEELQKLRKDLDFMMTRYEGELKRPIRNVVTGKLPRTLLIQVQKLKVDLEAAMLQLDQILRANELSIALVAAIPAFIAGGLTIVGVVRWLTPTPPDAKWEALPCRMAMVEVERALQALTDGESAEEQGILIYRLAIVYREAVTLFRRHKLDSNTPQGEWRNMRADLVQLASPQSVSSKSRIVKRMMRVYTIFRI